MTKIKIHSFLPARISILYLFFLQLITGSANESLTSTSKGENQATSNKRSGPSVGVVILIVCIGILAVVAFSTFLYKLWQKKKREEQHARLLKLFEEDDDLEVELGIRD